LSRDGNLVDNPAVGLLQILKLPPRPARGAAALAEKTVGGGTKTERLAQAAARWRQTHQTADDRIEALKSAIKAHYAGAHPELLQEIETGVAKLDGVLDNVDHRLADVMTSASKAADDAARKAELKSAKTLLTEYIVYVKSEPLIAHMDSNPFGVTTGLRALLANGLTEAAKAIG
jgi:hypothetical protein